MYLKDDILECKSVVRVVKGERYHTQEDVHMCTKNDEEYFIFIFKNGDQCLYTY